MLPDAVWPDTFSVASVWRFDLKKLAWSKLPDLPSHRAGGGSAVLNNHLHFFGGGQSAPGNEVRLPD